jgi:AAA15 family ATPase/GTPase
MIIQFTVGNYRSFHERQTINFRPTGLVSENKEVDKCNILSTKDGALLKILGVYGSNASGKSNLIKALAFFKEFIANSLTFENFLSNEYNPFKLSQSLSDNSGYFQIILLIKGKKYRYGFSIDDKAHIQSEWLFGPADKNETFYFTRKGSKIEVNDERFKEGTQLPYSRLRADALFLTFCSSYDGNISGRIKDYLTQQVIIENTSARSLFYSSTFSRSRTNRLLKTGNKDIVLRWLAEAGLNFNDIELRELASSNTRLRNYILLTKNIYNESGEIVDKVTMDLDADESEGTKKFYNYIGDLSELFTHGGIYISDEIDNNFHPSLLLKLIKLFQNKSVNSAGAQLLFTSHDVNLMHPEIMRRDQFYFTEKTVTDSTKLFSLADLKGIRNNADFARQYLAGYYGALPKLGTFLEEESI